ncbi:hypothetical protein GIB67_004551 [Kingdonia uniflora]|uniref:Zinc finger PMZ-type domain-containing protein n=1 Tax=Kingdonia uniflora TaxID=39325 RepID=A0A7J7ML46_9MAGN|nr:hypothetical protein GIB67_004551 [Kingdonia uniflora]
MTAVVKVAAALARAEGEKEIMGIPSFDETRVSAGMNGVQLYTIVHFGGDIVPPKIGSIVTYVGGSTKLTSLRAHSSYKDFLTLLKEISEIRREDCKGLCTTKDTGSGRGLSPTKAGEPLRHNLFPDLEPEYRDYPKTNGRGLDQRRFGPFVDDDNDSFETIHTDVPPSNEPSIPQSNVHLSNEPVLTNGKDLLDFWLKSDVYTENPYDFSKEFNIGDLYRDRIELKNHIRAYAVVNKFNLEHVLSNEYKIVVRYKGHKCSWQIYVARYGVAYINHVESWDNVILKVKDLPIHVFIEELRRICSKMSYTYREEAEKNQARLTPWAMDHCEGRKTDSVNIEDGTCSCRWWQTMGIPYEHGVRALGLTNVDPTTRVSEFYTNNKYKAVYEPIGIPIYEELSSGKL